MRARARQGQEARAKARARATTREEMQNDLGKVKAAEVVDRLKNYGLAVEDLGLDISIRTIDLLPFNWQAVWGFGFQGLGFRALVCKARV